MVINPYESINWNSITKVVSTSHAHGKTQKSFRNGIDGGLQHIMYSNYYPSAPAYPLEDWFSNIPSNIIGSPNAEHHNFGVNLCHLNGLGCTLITGNEKGVSPVGMASIGVTRWEDAIDAILGTLMYEDAGGVTINHPTWTHLATSLALKMLDYDDRVLGIEIVNSATQNDDTAYSFAMWDEILLTNRRCWGFCVPDHGIEASSRWTGRNILLTDNLTNYGCLKAYRDGAFYSQIFDSNLSFDDIDYSNNSLHISALNADKIVIVIDGNAIEHIGNSISIQVPQDSIYVRVEAWKDYEWLDPDNNMRQVVDKIFSNPITISNEEKINRRIMQKCAKIYDI